MTKYIITESGGNMPENIKICFCEEEVKNLVEISIKYGFSAEVKEEEIP